jgi:hypothetical protein
LAMIPTTTLQRYSLRRRVFLMPNE